jgi:hypothetical protein
MMIIITKDEGPLEIVLALHNRLQHQRDFMTRAKGGRLGQVKGDLDDLLEQYRFMLEIHGMFERLMDPSSEVTSADLKTSST